MLSVVRDSWNVMAVSGEDVTQDNEDTQTRLLYNVNDKPNYVLSIFLGIQHYLTTLGGVISIPFILGPALCILDNDPSLGYLISSIFMVSGTSTLLQATLGVRLPIIQGSSYAFIICILCFLQLPQWNCPPQVDLYAMGTKNRTAEWQDRMLEIQGGVISVAALEILIGYTGLVGLFLRYVSPLTIAPTIALVGISMVPTALKLVSGNWYIAFGTFTLVLIFSQLLRNLHTPVPAYSISKGWHITWILGFQLFSILLPTVFVCVICYILASFEVLDTKDFSTKNTQQETMELVQWFRIPYPFQWGWPRFTLNSIFAMIAAVSVDIVESISDYYACASICGKPAPTMAAINRGIGIEGVGCLIAGIFGVGPGVTSFSENIGAIGITKVGNQRVIIIGAIIMIILSAFGKVGALFALIPTPIVGGLLCVMFSIVSSVGLSNLKYVNMKSHRNLFVIGSAMFFGLAIPYRLELKPEEFATGYMTVDQIIVVLLSTPFFVGFCLSILLDNILPGTIQERGLLLWHRENNTGSASTLHSIYDLPGTINLRNVKKTGLYIAVTTCTR